VAKPLIPRLTGLPSRQVHKLTYMFYISNSLPQTESISDGNNAVNQIYIADFLTRVFLPAGYPDSVSPGTLHQLIIHFAHINTLV